MEKIGAKGKIAEVKKKKIMKAMVGSVDTNSFHSRA